MKNKFSLKILFALIATFVFAGVVFGSVKASAKAAELEKIKMDSKVEWEYDASTDVFKIEFINAADTENPENLGVFTFSGDKSKLDTTRTKWKAKKVLNATEIASATGGAFAVDKKDSNDKTGYKLSAKKDSYIAIAKAEDTTTKYNYDSTSFIKLQAQAATISKVVIDYAKAVSGSGLDKQAIYSIAYKVTGGEGSVETEFVNGKDSEGQVIAKLKSNYGDEESDVFCYVEWTTDASDATGGRTWYSAEDFTGEELAKVIAASNSVGRNQNVYFRMKGQSIAATYDTSKVGIRPSAEKKISVAKTPKAPNVKIEVKKANNIKLKNGMDYVIVASGDALEDYNDKWITILPYKKAEAKGAQTMPSNEFRAVAMPKNPPASAKEPADGTDIGEFYYTTAQVKSLNLRTLIGWEDRDENAVVIYIRQSAKTSKPASEVMSITLERPLAAPGNADSNPNGFGVAVTGEAIKFTYSEGSIEYALVKQADAEASFVSLGDGKYKVDDAAQLAVGKIDFTTLSWKKVKSAAKAVAPGASLSGYKVVKTLPGADNKIEYKEAYKGDAKKVAVGDYIIVRFQGSAGKTGSNHEDPRMSSDIAVYKITKCDKKDKSKKIDANYIEITPVYNGEVGSK